MTAEAIQAWLVSRLSTELGIDPGEIDIREPFTSYGLDSVRAVSLSGDLEDWLGRRLSPTLAYEYPTVESLARYLAGEPDAVATPGPARDMTPAATYSLSQGQRALWFLYRLAPESAAYNVTFAARILSGVDIPALHRALQALVDRHASLRTTFPSRDGMPVQVVRDDSRVHFVETDASSWSEHELRGRLVEEAHRPFNLGTGPVLRVTLYARAERAPLLLVSVHHIVYDAASLVVLLDELGALYATESSGARAALPAPRRQYADYVHWQADMLAGAEGELLWTYWRHQLRGELPVLHLPTDRPRPPVQTYRGAAHAFRVGEDLTRRLRSVARTEGVTLFTVLMAAFQVLLHRYAGQDDILLGTPMGGRTKAEFRSSVGYFINAVVLRADLSGNPTVKAFVGQVRQTVLGALEHQDYPFHLLVDRLQPPRDPSRSPLFQVMFNMLQADRLGVQSVSQFVLSEGGARTNLGGLELELFPVEQRVAMFDLLLTMAEAGGSLAASMQYNTDLFDAGTIARMVGHYQTLLEGITSDSGRRVADLPLLTPAERHLMLAQWNETRADYPRESSFPELFEAQVQRTPNAVAAACQDRALTYRQLNQRANRVARVLVEHGVGPDAVVALLAARGLEFLTGVLAILKAGGAYLPLDPRHPAARHVQVLDQSRAPVVLAARQFVPVVSEALADVPSERRPRVLSIEDLLRLDRNEGNLPSSGTPRHLAYVIYTSGSTGVPKGAMIEQRGMINHLYAMIADLTLVGSDVVAQNASQCFDISVWQFLAALLVGGCVHIFPDDVALDPSQLLDQVDRYGISVLEVVPSLLSLMVEEIAARAPARPGLAALRWMIPTGEALPPELCRQWLSHYPDIPMVNAYGPAECSDDVTLHPISTAPAVDVVRIPIGRPIANTRLYIVDAQLRPVPIGVAGELCVGGDGVGRGYLNEPDRTAEVFVPDPFAAEPGARLYRTGDLAHYLPDGAVEFLGRLDDQVKIRGFRVEPGEIEAVLGRHPGVRDSAVVAREDIPGRKRLVAYVVPTETQTPTIGDLRAFLKEKLPDYMVPTAFVLLGALPFLANGKVDRRALPAPDDARPDLDGAFAAPRTPAEETLARIWSQVLGVDRVGVHDNFFELGGDSILSIQILARANQAGLRLTPMQFFQHQTIAELAEATDAAGAQAIEGERQAVSDFDASWGLGALATLASELGTPADAIEAAYPLSPMQEIMLAQTLQAPRSGVYVEQLSCTFRGELDIPAFTLAWQQTADRHPILRSRCVCDRRDRPLQVVLHHAALPWRQEDWRGLPEAEQQARLDAYLELDRVRGFDLSKAPLMRFALHQVAGNTYQFVWSSHHLLLDAWSGGLLLREVFAAYDALRDGRNPDPDRPRPYRDYIAWLSRQSRSAAERYWRRTLQGLTAPTRIDPGTAPERMSDQEPVYGEQRLRISNATTSALQSLGRQHRLTLNTIVQGAWAVLLDRYSGQDDVLFGAIVSGRPAALAGVDGMVGLLINTLPVRVRITPAVSLLSWLKILQAQQVELRHYEYSSLAQIQASSEFPPDVPLFESVLRFQNYPVEPSLRARIANLEIRNARFTDIWAYPISLVVEPSAELSLAVTYDRRRFTAASGVQILEDLKAIFEAMAADPQQQVGTLLRPVEASPR